MGVGCLGLGVAGGEGEVVGGVLEVAESLEWRSAAD